jgi:hypothetical protein
MAGWNCTPLKAPFCPPKSAWSFHSPKTPDESTWGSPLRRIITLADGFRRAMKNQPAHRGQ